MERSRMTLLTLVCVWFSSISGEQMEMRVRPGDNVTLYSDCVWENGLTTVWFRNSSHCEPPLIMPAPEFMVDSYPRYSIEWNSSNQTHDLLVKNVSESDLGLYYCATQKNMLLEDTKKVLHQKDIYLYGNRTTRLSLLVSCFNLTQPIYIPPDSNCSVCWKLLVSVCPVCVLLSLTCMYCIHCYRTKDAKAGQKEKTKSKRQKSRTRETIDQVVEGEREVCYASLDLPSRGQKRLKKKTKRDECSDFSIYSEVKTEIL